MSRATVHHSSSHVISSYNVVLAPGKVLVRLPDVPSDSIVAMSVIDVENSQPKLLKSNVVRAVGAELTTR